MTDEADRSLVLALLQVAFLGRVMTKDWEETNNSNVFTVCCVFLAVSDQYQAQQRVIQEASDFVFRKCVARRLLARI